MTNQKAWMFFNTETPLPKNQEYYTEEEIVEAMQKYADQQLILSGVVQPKANSSIIKPVCVCDEMTKEGISSWWCEACKTDWV